MSFAIYPKRTKLVFALASLKKDADEKRKTLILLFSPAFILKIQKMHPTSIFGCKKGCKSRNYLIYTLYCGERGIRTPGASQLNGFQDRRNRPLCHLSSDKSTSVFSICQIFLHFFNKNFVYLKLSLSQNTNFQQKRVKNLFIKKIILILYYILKVITL